jgi:hypothetical protein
MGDNQSIIEKAVNESWRELIAGWVSANAPSRRDS